MKQSKMKIFSSAMVRDSKSKTKNARKKTVVSDEIRPTYKVKTKTSPKSNDVTFDFSYTEWLKTIKHGEFTNKLKGSNEFAKLIYTVMNKLIPYITEHWHWIEKNAYPGSGHHCHPVVPEKLHKVKEIINKTHSVDLEPMIENDKSKVLWQLGHQGAVRLIVYYMSSSKTFYPLFVDYHHLIHPVSGDKRSQIKHNDYKRKHWCPVESFN
ncbi:hypothetical protein ACLIBH_10220 [Virgibacillus sp. W0430]|uniref:hypothetical protein n=1 Tax=Virgibacillus sp. W0430 TaxID=3391580 RepID=UPI003F45D416